MTYHLKHGMMTVRPAGAAAGAGGHGGQARVDDAPRVAPGMSADAREAPRRPVPVDGGAIVLGFGSRRSDRSPASVLKRPLANRVPTPFEAV